MSYGAAGSARPRARGCLVSVTKADVIRLQSMRGESEITQGDLAPNSWTGVQSLCPEGTR
jgi:hypothetical protein